MITPESSIESAATPHSGVAQQVMQATKSDAAQVIKSGHALINNLKTINETTNHNTHNYHYNYAQTGMWDVVKTAGDKGLLIVGAVGGAIANSLINAVTKQDSVQTPVYQPPVVVAPVVTQKSVDKTNGSSDIFPC